MILYLDLTDFCSKKWAVHKTDTLISAWSIAVNLSSIILWATIKVPSHCLKIHLCTYKFWQNFDSSFGNAETLIANLIQWA